MDAHDHGTVPGLAAPEPAHHHHSELAPPSAAAAHALVTSRNDEALTTVDAAQGFKGQEATDKLNSPSAPHAGQALRVIEGERKAADFLARLQAQQADPDELALIVGMLYGPTLRGFCRVIAKAIDQVGGAA